MYFKVISRHYLNIIQYWSTPKGVHLETYLLGQLSLSTFIWKFVQWPFSTSIYPHPFPTSPDKKEQQIHSQSQCKTCHWNTKKETNLKITFESSRLSGKLRLLLGGPQYKLGGLTCTLSHTSRSVNFCYKSLTMQSHSHNILYSIFRQQMLFSSLWAMPGMIPEWVFQHSRKWRGKWHARVVSL